MGSVSTEFPPEFSLKAINTENKKETAMQVRAALEEHGFIVLKYEEGEYMKEEIMAAIEEYFSLDLETKVKSGRTGPINTYSAPGELGFPSYEAVTVPNSREGLEKFSRLNWPDGNDRFCEALCSTSKDLFQLGRIVLDMVVTSYDLGNEAMSCFPTAGSPCRLSRYMRSEEEGEVGLGVHVDGTYITILWQNDVQGLMVKSKHGNWFDVILEKNSFLVFVGAILQVWSNGKMMAPEHRIMTNGENDRYSITLFMGPADLEDVLQAQSQLVNDENPARFKPFLYKDYLAYTAKHLSLEGTIEKFAGI